MGGLCNVLNVQQTQILRHTEASVHSDKQQTPILRHCEPSVCLLISMHSLWGLRKVFRKLWGDAKQLWTSTKDTDLYQRWSALTQTTASH